MSFSTRRTIDSFGAPGIAAAISFTSNSQFPIFRGEPMIPRRLPVTVIALHALMAERYVPEYAAPRGRSRRGMVAGSTAAAASRAPDGLNGQGASWLLLESTTVRRLSGPAH